jgi:hypothetical protein
VRVLQAAGDRIGKLGKDRLAEIDEWVITQEEKTRRRDSA